MDEKEKLKFADTFVGVYLSQGFGSLPKSEIDLLVFHLLTESADNKAMSNYELSTHFRITESKIKSLKLNSALKYQEINSKAVLAKIILRFIESEQFAEFTEGKVELSLEDPIEKRELEHFLKVRGHHAEYALNSEVLRISHLRLFELIVDNLENPSKSFADIMQAHVADEELAKKLTRKASTLSQRFSLLRKEAFSANSMRTLIEAGASILLNS
ncbi:MAG: hypothetical protein ACJAVI_003139 [Candidatus Azotimanducaceae bacterium]|jgi:hypothetical protein